MALGKSDRDERVKIIGELDKNLLVSASAGSGKTTILVERMVALVESGKVNLSKMAALTFTKKAADEFYDRFYKKLQKRIKPGFTVAKDDQHSLLKDPTTEAVLKDKEALKSIDTCFFGTIDAFYQKILNEHPLEAGLSSSARIVDDDEFNAYLLHKFNEFLEDSNPAISGGASFFAQYIGADNFATIMTTVLNNAELDLNQLSDDIEKLEEYYQNRLIDMQNLCNTLVEYETYFRPYKDEIEAIDVTDTNRKKWELLLERNSLIKKLKPGDYKTGLRAFNKLDELRFREDPKGLLDFDKYGDFIADHETRHKKDGYQLTNYISCLLKKIVYIKTIDFLNAVKPIIREDLVNDGLLTFSEATIKLLELLKNEKDNKEVIEQIRSKIDCLLIDECQDTDIKQYEIFFRLAANDFNEDFSKLTINGGKLYACGDRKQGIYHFRGADVSTYDYIKEIFETKKELALPFDLVTLTDNYRSKGNVIRYFNRTFETMLAAQGYSPVLNDDVNPGEENFGAFSYETDAERDPEAVADLILRLMQELKCDFKDFMIITSNKRSINSYSREFSKRGIPCYSEGNIDINVSSLSSVVINIFKYISSNKTDTISYLEILTSPLFNFDVKKTIDMNRDFIAEVGLDLEKTEWASDLLEKIASNKTVLKALNCKGIDVLIGFIHLLKEEENAGNIVSYSDAIKYFSDIQKDEKKIERLSLLADSINAVQIANAHKTKGLEKKIVIVTKAGANNAGSETIKTNDTLYFNSFTNAYNSKVLDNPTKVDNPVLAALIDKEKAYAQGENLRLLYVVATRAREYLFLPTWYNKKGTLQKGRWQPLFSDLVKDYSRVITHNFKVSQSEVEIKQDKDTTFKDFDRTKKEYCIIAPSQIQSPNKFNEEYETSSLDRTDALVFGTMVHKLLENIVKAKNLVLDASMCEYIANEQNRPDLINKLEEVRKTIYSGGYTNQKECPFVDLLKEAKEFDCFTEVPFSYKEKETIVNGFIDLILVNKDKAIIIDYKTDASEVDHTSQLKCYEEALKLDSNFENKKISSYIYHIYK